MRPKSATGEIAARPFKASVASRPIAFAGNKRRFLARKAPFSGRKCLLNRWKTGRQSSFSFLEMSDFNALRRLFLPTAPMGELGANILIVYACSVLGPLVLRISAFDIVRYHTRSFL
jgi:hypothetical protein